MINFIYPDYTYQHELQIFDYINKIPLEDNFYDLGACVGTFSLYAGLRGLSCVAFEIDPINFIGLQANVLANNLIDKVTILNSGISNGQTTEGILLVNPLSSNNIGAHCKNLDITEHTASTVDRSAFQKIRVPVDSLDHFVENLMLPIPLHAKVDIDGSELAFLRGSPKALGSLKSLMIEIFEGNSLHREVLSIIDSAGFKLQYKHPIFQPGCEEYFNCEYWK